MHPSTANHSRCGCAAAILDSGHCSFCGAWAITDTAVQPISIRLDNETAVLLDDLVALLNRQALADPSDLPAGLPVWTQSTAVKQAIRTAHGVLSREHA